ncbi:hypothetical protein IU474_05175 [Nocardia otitidiscaviarum]|uniref:hypothetical protein n=1 Tax=Nocardia otitidiscaviarum TaxID=1823 RepID=UPI001895D3AB|nr:hypothetical protein [Nocardia otitidiscaviarum]MBF6236471.1 hypothetical protein [Nocardia otitidiscaviarum]
MFLALRGAISFVGSSVAEDPILRGMNILGIAVVLAILAAISVLLFTLVLGRGKNYLALTEEGVNWSAGRSVSTIEWDDIDRISPVLYANLHAVRISPQPWVKVKVRGGGFGRRELESSITIPAGQLKIDPPLLLRLIRFYWKYPESRAELTSDAVIDRMRRADFRKPKNLPEESSRDGAADLPPLRFRSARGLDSSSVTDS